MSDAIRQRTDTPPDSIVLYADNYINDIEGEKLETVCNEHFKNGMKKIVIDFSNTEMVNSIGISILIGIIESARVNESVLMFSGLRESNRKIFDMFDISKYVSIVATEDEALKEIANT